MLHDRAVSLQTLIFYTARFWNVQHCDVTIATSHQYKSWTNYFTLVIFKSISYIFNIMIIKSDYSLLILVNTYSYGHLRMNQLITKTLDFIFGWYTLIRFMKNMYCSNQRVVYKCFWWKIKQICLKWFVNTLARVSISTCNY